MGYLHHIPLQVTAHYNVLKRTLFLCSGHLYGIQIPRSHHLLDHLYLVRNLLRSLVQPHNSILSSDTCLRLHEDGCFLPEIRRDLRLYRGFQGSG